MLNNFDTQITIIYIITHSKMADFSKKSPSPPDYNSKGLTSCGITFPLIDAAEAYRALETGNHAGKIVLVTGN